MSTLRKISNFAVIGVINTFVDFAILNVLIGYAGLGFIPARSISFIIASLGSYVLNSQYTFKVGLSYRRYGIFLSITLFGFCINVYGGDLLLHTLNQILPFNFTILVNISALITVVFSSVTNFVLYNYFFTKEGE